MIRCIEVHKSYRLAGGQVPALRGVSLEIAGAGYHAIMGQSGSGKSTLLHLLGALDRPDQGSIEVGGQAIHQLTERQATAFRRTGIGIVFQQFNLIATLSARENIELPGMLAGERAGWLRERSDALLDRLGLAHRADHRPDAMSGGEQQRVAIGRALLFSPPVLLADEPTGNLDSASSARIWSLLADLAAEHEMTVVMVTHEPAAAAHCRAVHVLQDGTVLGTIETGGMDAAGVAACYQRLVRPA